VSVSSISFPGFLTFPSHSLREKPWKLGYRILWTARQRQSSSARVISSWKSKEQKQKTNYVKRKEWIHAVKAKWELVRSIIPRSLLLVFCLFPLKTFYREEKRYTLFYNWERNDLGDSSVCTPNKFGDEQWFRAEVESYCRGGGGPFFRDATIPRGTYRTCFAVQFLSWSVILGFKEHRINLYEPTGGDEDKKWSRNSPIYIEYM